MTTMVAREPRRIRPFYQDISVQVFAGMVVGALIGWVSSWEGAVDRKVLSERLELGPA